MQTLKNTVVGLGMLMLVGCATSAPQARFTQPLAPSSLVRANDETKILVAAAPGVEMTDDDTNRLAQCIQKKIDSKKLSNEATGDKKEYAVNVTITRYAKGSAFARSMLAGLGQIHIDGTIKVLTMPAQEQVGEFTVKKTFAWGGMYGASTTIEDIEQGFAEGVADALTRQSDDSSANSHPAKTPR